MRVRIKRNLTMYISAMLSLVTLTLGFVMFWIKIEGAFLPFYMLLLCLPPSWILLQGVYAVDSTAKKILYSDDENFSLLKVDLIFLIKNLYLKFVSVMALLFSMAYFMVPENGDFAGSYYSLWAWIMAQSLFVFLLDKLMPLK